MPTKVLTLIFLTGFKFTALLKASTSIVSLLLSICCCNFVLGLRLPDHESFPSWVRWGPSSSSPCWQVRWYKLQEVQIELGSKVSYNMLTPSLLKITHYFSGDNLPKKTLPGTGFRVQVPQISGTGSLKSFFHDQGLDPSKFQEGLDPCKDLICV